MENPNPDPLAPPTCAAGPHGDSTRPRDSQRRKAAPFEASSSSAPPRKHMTDTPCRFFLQGRCMKNDACPFSHDPAHWRARRHPDSPDAPSGSLPRRSKAALCAPSKDSPVMACGEAGGAGNTFRQGLGRGVPSLRGRGTGRGRHGPNGVTSSRNLDGSSSVCAAQAPGPGEAEAPGPEAAPDAPGRSTDQTVPGRGEATRGDQRRRPRKKSPDVTRSSTSASGLDRPRGGRKSGVSPRRRRGHDISRPSSGDRESPATPASAPPQKEDQQTSPTVARPVSRVRGPNPSRPPCIPRRGDFGGPAARSDWTWEEERARLQKLYASSFLRVSTAPPGEGDGTLGDSHGAGESKHASTPGEADGNGVRQGDALGEDSRAAREGSGEKREDNENAGGTMEQAEERNAGAAGTAGDMKSFASSKSEESVVDIIRVTHTPTDPDFDSDILPTGLVVEITLRANYRGCCRRGEEGRLEAEEGRKAEEGSGLPKRQRASDPVRRPLDGATLRVCNEELGDFLRETIPKVFQEYLLKNTEEPFLVYGALKFVDRHLATVFALSRTHGSAGESKATPTTKGGEGEKGDEPEKKEWTLDEQKRLEEGLVWYRRVADPVTKWKLIGSFVRTRTAKECAQRFRDCREAILRRAERSPGGRNRPHGLPVGRRFGDTSSCAESPRGMRQVQEVSRHQTCDAKGWRRSRHLGDSGRLRNLSPAHGCAVPTQNCICVVFHDCNRRNHSVPTARFTAKRLHCHLRQVHGDDENQGSLSSALSSATAKSLLVSSGEKKKKAKDEFTLKLGTPLPDNGTCKHYKKSFRWLRFPCCGKAFPCDVCHDDSADHEHAWATRMICGFCSKEQAFGNRPCECGRALTKDGSTAHWEGGKGCRDAVRMNKKDSRKYKLLSRQQAEAGGNKGGRK
uniref:Zinc finger (CHY type) protein, putative n=1 Tax=Neospora caninum (strain Liverpool) TaxID=572307 RepID=F0JB88_NEOCL|nr:zinc finger (CHY type) protein, putative [Neospora caninum Liverpool]CEL71355.1 TPA: zinc finger (CHY type) protein, putative [Neospora caninum Liverpool]